MKVRFYHFIVPFMYYILYLKIKSIFITITTTLQALPTFFEVLAFLIDLLFSIGLTIHKSY